MTQVISPRARAIREAALEKLNREIAKLPRPERTLIERRLKYVWDADDRISIGWSLIHAAEKRRDQTPAEKSAEEAARQARVAAYLGRVG